MSHSWREQQGAGRFQDVESLNSRSRLTACRLRMEVEGHGALEDLAEKFATFCKRQDSLPVVSLEEFFEANDVRYSMGANLSDDEHPGIQGFYRLLHSIRDRPDVQGVFVELRHYDGADEWPYSDTVFIVTSAPRDAIESSLAELHPTEILEGWGVRPEIKTPLLESQLRPGMHVWRTWWD